MTSGLYTVSLLIPGNASCSVRVVSFTSQPTVASGMSYRTGQEHLGQMHQNVAVFSLPATYRTTAGNHYKNVPMQYTEMFLVEKKI